MSPNDCKHLQIETCYQYDSKKNRTVFWACPECRMLFQPKGLADAELVAENEMLLDALVHSGYDPDDCIDCGGPPHNEYCRFWKVRHLLPFDMVLTGEESDKCLEERNDDETE